MLAEETVMDAGDLNTHRESRSRKSLGANRELHFSVAGQPPPLLHPTKLDAWSHLYVRATMSAVLPGAEPEGWRCASHDRQASTCCQVHGDGW